MNSRNANGCTAQLMSEKYLSLGINAKEKGREHHKRNRREQVNKKEKQEEKRRKRKVLNSYCNRTVARLAVAKP